MATVRKLVPLAEYKKPLLKLKDEDRWIIDRLNERVKESEAKIEQLTAELHEKHHPRDEWKAIINSITKEKNNVAMYNEFIRQEKAMSYEEQLKSLGLR